MSKRSHGVNSVSRGNRTQERARQRSLKKEEIKKAKKEAESKMQQGLKRLNKDLKGKS